MTEFSPEEIFDIVQEHGEEALEIFGIDNFRPWYRKSGGAICCGGMSSSTGIIVFPVSFSQPPTIQIHSHPAAYVSDVSCQAARVHTDRHVLYKAFGV